MSDNPFFSSSSLPHQLPPFAEIREEHYRPAFERALSEQAADLERIAHNPEPATFVNTIVALEHTGALLDRIAAVFFNQKTTNLNPTLQEIADEINPRLSEQRDAMFLNPLLYERVKKLYDDRELLDLSEEEQRLLERYHMSFIRAGAALSEQDKESLRKLNKELVDKASTFSKNLISDNANSALLIEDLADLKGLSEDAIAAAKESGKELGHEGKYALSLKSYTNQPLLASLDNREIRQRLFEASIGRGLKSNRHVVIEMAKLRAQKAALFGYANHAEYVVSDQTAGTTAAVVKTMQSIIPAILANVDKEANALRSIVGNNHKLEPWDWAYYSEKIRQSEYNVDAEALLPYFELNRVLIDGVFFAATKVYGLTFEERPDLVGYNPEVRTFEVFNEDGSPLGLYLADFYERPNKKGGAWMGAFSLQSGLLKEPSVTYTNFNFSKPAEGKPKLLTFDEVITLFHEFGHVLHNLFCEAHYPLLSSYNVPWDFIEFPSKVNEMWATWPEILANYARHYETGDPIPEDLLERMIAAAKFGQGFKKAEHIAATMLDWAWHTIPADFDPGDVETFEANALKEAGLAIPEIPPRYRSTYFSHIFYGNYSGNFYTYIWSEILDADVVEWFKNNGKPIRESGEIFRHKLLGKGNTMDPMLAVENLLGRKPDIQPFLVRNGLAG